MVIIPNNYKTVTKPYQIQDITNLVLEVRDMSPLFGAHFSLHADHSPQSLTTQWTKNYPVILFIHTQFENRNLPGQSGALHFLIILSSPEHSFPPPIGVGLVQNLLLIWMPSIKSLMKTKSYLNFASNIYLLHNVHCKAPTLLAMESNLHSLHMV